MSDGIYENLFFFKYGHTLIEGMRWCREESVDRKKSQKPFFFGPTGKFLFFFFLTAIFYAKYSYEYPRGRKTRPVHVPVLYSYS